MNKENWQWLLLAFVAIGLIGLGAVIVSQNSQLKQVSKSLTIIGTELQNLSERQSAVPSALVPSFASTTPTPTIPDWKLAISKLTPCDGKKEFGESAPDKATLIALGLESLLAEGFNATQVCFDASNNRVAFILAKQELRSPATGAKSVCMDNCDKDIFGTVDFGSGALNYQHSLNQLGIYSESYNQYCLIDKTIPGASQMNDKILFYCGSAESGGLTNWYQYDFNGGKLTSVQILANLDPEKFEVLSPTILKLFQYKSNADIHSYN